MSTNDRTKYMNPNLYDVFVSVTRLFYNALSLACVRLSIAF